jgi:CBS domain-containing protein
VKVAEIMNTELRGVAADATLADAIITLADAHVYGLPVLDESTGDFIGVLSTSDVLEAEAECGNAEDRDRLFENTTIRELMTSKPATIGPDEAVRVAAQQMLYLDVHRLFVVDEGDLVGIVSQSDIVRAVGTAKL